MIKNISLIIPSLSDDFFVNDFLVNICFWSLKPKEIIIINTSKKKYFINKETIQILKEKKIKLNLFNKKNFFPGKARNFGILKASCDYIAFLDMNTVPYSCDWLKVNFNHLIKKNLDIVLGQTYYLANNYMEKIIRSSTYGKIYLTTVPGSILNKKIFNKVGVFNKNIRAGEDTDWLIRLNLSKLKIGKSLSPIFYKGLNNINYAEVIRKWFRNYSSSANLPHLFIQKNIYIFSLFIFLFFLVYNWNYYLNLNTNNYFIPHITKIFLGICMILYSCLRGIYLPLKKKINYKFLFPFNFILITIFSFILDLVKTLTFVLASLLKAGFLNKSK